MRTFLAIVALITGISTVWAEVGPLNLERSVEIALANNHGLLSASKKVASAKEKVWEAKTGFYPIFSLSSSYTRLNEATTVDFQGRSMALSDEGISEAKGIIQQPLFTGGKISSGYKLAKANYEAAKYEYEMVKNELILEVKSAYFGILKALKFQQIAQEAVEQVQAHLKVVGNFYDVGMVAKVDVLKAEVELANVKQNLIRAENGVRLANAAFNQVLAQDQNTPVEIIDILEFRPQTINLDNCIKQAQTMRPELKQIKTTIEVLKQRVKIARSDYYPSVALIGNYDYQKGKKTPIDEWQETWMAAVSVNFTLWDWKARKSRVNQTEANLAAVEEQLLLLKDRILLEVRQGCLGLEEAEKNIGVAQKSIGQAEENLRITKEMYKEGASTTTDVLDAQTLLTQAKTNYYQALYDYNLAWAKLQKAIGRN
ncbi:MAG: TolC family protein [bacterium]